MIGCDLTLIKLERICCNNCQIYFDCFEAHWKIVFANTFNIDQILQGLLVSSPHFSQGCFGNEVRCEYLDDDVSLFDLAWRLAWDCYPSQASCGLEKFLPPPHLFVQISALALADIIWTAPAC